MKIYDLVIVGGGVSGMTVAASVDLKNVLLLEKEDRIGKKLLATGNGRCNLLNQNFSVEAYNDKNFVAHTFDVSGFDTVRNFFESLGLFLRFDDEGRGYPYSESASSVLEAYRRKLRKNNTEIRTSIRVVSIGKEGGFFKISSDADAFYAKNVVVATGSDAGFGTNSLQILKNFADTDEFVPSLVPLITETETIKGLNGVRVKCAASLISDGKRVHTEKGEILFKSFGISGIAAFNLSAYYVRGGKKGNSFISLNLLDTDVETAAEELRDKAKYADNAEALLSGFFHKMLVQAILKYSKTDALACPDEEKILRLSKAVTDFRIKIKDVADKSLAQVMNGGVKTSSVNEKTLEIKGAKGLYVAGECVDVDGLSGGYNIMWAVASALEAGKSVKA